MVKWTSAPRLRSDHNKSGDLGEFFLLTIQDNLIFIENVIVVLGQSVIIPQELTEYASKHYEKYKLNVVASQMISVNRTLIDYRHKQ